MNDDGEKMMTTSANSAASPPFLLAQKVCEAMEQREYSQLSSLLDIISTHNNKCNNNSDGVAKEDSASPSSKCQQILQIFYSSIGRNDDIHTTSNNNNDTTATNNNSAENNTTTIPMDIKSHLLLRALLHYYPTIHQNNSCNNMTNNSLLLQWEAAIATVQSIQYSFSSSIQNNNNNTAANSVSEEMAMIAEVRSFVANLRSGAHNSNSNNINESSNSNNEDGDEDENENIIGNLTNTLECLLELGLVIVAPLLIHNDDDGNSHHQQQQQIMKRINYKQIHQGNNNNNYTRREHSYLLPLELLPGIFATLDVLEDVLADLMSVRDQQQRQQREEEEMEWEHRQFVQDNEMNNDVNNDEEERNESSDQEHNADNHDSELYIRYSDKLLSAIYVPFIAKNNNNSNGGGVDKIDKLQRSIRADASLPVLALAIDDIGNDRMGMTVPTLCNNDNYDEDITYWDCLALSLHHVIQSNLLCYSSNDEREELNTNNDRREQIIINEATNDEGMHLIAPSDYPAMIRCVFRMIATNSSFNNNNKSEHTLGWESLLLQLYHAAAVVSAKVPSIKSLRPRRNNSASEHHSATLSTVESHVLLPSFTGASVTAIRSILDACQQESCVSCKQMSMNTTTWWQSFTNNDTATPNWAIAGIVLLIMRARSSNLSNAMGSSSSSCSFGPRAVFRIASDIMRKKAAANDNKSVMDKVNNRVGLGSDDEIGHALSVLLAIRGGGGEEGSGCLSCSDEIRYNADADKCALDVLGDTYYAGSGKFRHKYLVGQEEKAPYAYQLGHKTLTQYADLFCSSLNQGKLSGSGSIESSESSISETAKTWIDAAYMILDEMTNSESREKGSLRKSKSNIPNGTAMALTVIVVVFCEVPSSQHDIVRSVYDRLVHSSSRTSNDIMKRKASEKCFILASLLAWSLVANHERNSTLSFVRNKGGRSDEIKAVLGPLCNLLTTPAPVYDVFLGTEKPSLSYWALQQLSRSLIPIYSGREAILAMAKKHLRLTSTPSPYSFTSAQVVPFSESMPSTPSAMRDALNFAVDCLCTLIEKHDPLNECSIPDECGLEALVMISDIIASSSSSVFVNAKMSSARVPRVVLSRLLNELIMAVKNSRLNEWVSRRLQRTCFFALMNFFESEDGVGSPALMTRRVVRSTNNGASFQITTDVVAVLQLTMSIQNSLDENETAFDTSLKHQILSVLPGKISHKVSNEVPESDEGKEQSSVDIDSACVAFMLQGVAKAIQIDTFVQHANVDRAVTHQMVNAIVQAERDHYRDKNKPKSSCPKWLDADHSAQVNYGYQELTDHLTDDLRTSGEYKDFYASMCNIVIRALLRRDEKLDEGSEFSDKVLLRLHYVLHKRQKVCRDRGSSNSLQDASFDDTSRRLLDLSAQYLQRLLLSNSELSEIDLVLRNLLKLCDESECSVASIESAWKVYCSLDDKSSQSLISCIKKYRMDEDGWKRVKSKPNGTVSLLSIDSSDDMEEHVRYYRSIILDKTSKDLTYFTESTAVLPLDERVTNLRVLLKILLKVCEDWHAAFNGLSGGMGKLIFNNFLEIADKCTDALVSYIGKLPSRVLLEVKDGFVNVLHSISAVWSIFNEEKLYGMANHTKGTVRLCIDKMPHLLRRVEILIGDVIINETTSNHSITLLDQCLLQIKSGAASEDKNAKTDNPGRNGQAVEEECEEREFEIENEEEPTRMLNISSETVEWVYTSVFTAFQKMWGDNYKLISRGKLKRNSFNPIQERSVTLSLRKRRELSSTLAAMCKVFDESNPSSKTSMIFAELFSYQGKSTLCKCLESITSTLLSSTKHLNQYFQSDQKQRRRRRETTSFDEAKLRDPLICILGWLSSARANDAAHNIITGAVQWYTNEKERLNAMFARSEDYPVLNRLPKLMYRLEVLEAELRKLVIILNDSSLPAWKEKICLLDQMTTDLDVNEDNTSLLEFLQDYLRELNSRKREMKIDGIESAVLGGGDGEDAESDLDGDMTKKRPRQQFGPRRKRRMSLRSRNDTIDNWLAMDDDNFAAAPGERYNDVDAFVDLEDFLVDG